MITEVQMPSGRVSREIQGGKRMCVEWNSSGGGIADAARDFGLRTSFLQHRHRIANEQFHVLYGLWHFQGGEIFIIGGGNLAAEEVDKSKWAAEVYYPQNAIITTPLGVLASQTPWIRIGEVDNTGFRDVTGSLWQIGR